MGTLQLYAIRVSAVFVVFCFTLHCPYSLADDDEVNLNRAVGTSYCGLHCVYGVARMVDSQVTFEQILEPRFINGAFGSTSENLILAFREFGIDSKYSPSFSIDRLRELNRPAILHVRPVGGRVYSHWILFLGFDGDEVRIFDPPQDEGRISSTELLSVWNGGTILPDVELPGISSTWTGGVMEKSPLSLSSLATVTFALSLLFVVSSTKRPSIAFCIAVIGGGTFVHLALSTGFTYGDSAIGIVQASYFRAQIPEITYEEARALSQDANVVFIDARTEEAFGRFHLPNAVSIPIDSTFSRLVNSIARLPKSAKYVFYCQSEGCRWADSIANQVFMRGFDDIFIYRGGVREWQAMHER
ncbi:MAG: hypothetical protein JNM43_11660 [Planctomycetaceae bacterium]|nr:hypothetical protein [Planctomycetaceae bacterium]